MSAEQINQSGGNFFEGWSDEEIESYRNTMKELASDLPGVMARMPAEERRKYKEAEQSVIDARLHPFRTKR